MKTITKTNENVAVIHEETVRNRQQKPLLSVKITFSVMTPELLKLVINI
jgi:hypothetical protein